MVARVELMPGYEVSRLTKGHWQLAERHGPSTGAAAALDGMRRFVEAGITNFDCADHYVGVEELIGAFRRSHPDLARRLTVQTKIVPDRDVLGRIRRADVERIVDRSLARLGVERLDLAQFHWWDYAAPGYVESMAWLAEMQRAGKIRALGVTNFDGRRLGEILAAGVPVVSHQVQYSILDRRPEHGMVELCRRHGVKLQCYGVVAGGFLSDCWLGARPPEPPLANRSLVKYRLIIDEFGAWDLFQDLLRVLDGIARKHGVGIAEVATRYVLDRPGVATAIVGARTAEHLADLLRADSLVLDDGDRRAIAGLVARSRGPQGDCYDLERLADGPHMRIMWMNQNLKGVGAR